MKIVALDIATQCGIAAGSSGGDPRCWSVNLGEPPEGRKMSDREKYALDGRRFSNALKLAQGLIETHKPDLIIIEAAIGGKDANAYLIGLVACVRGCAANRGIRCESVYPATARKHFLGKAKTSADFPGMKRAQAKLEIKREVMARCHLMGWDVQDTDAADAAATWDWACATYAPAYQAKPHGGLFHV
jgi:hypothetical protein